MVREVRGRGGRGGVSFEVRVDSLPLDLQERFRALSEISENRLRTDDPARIEREWWYGIIQPALAHPRHSRERGEAVRDIAERKHMRPDGRWVEITERTIQRKLAAYEKGNGLGGLTRRKRVDAGQAKVLLSAEWDRAVPFDPETKARLVQKVHQNLRNLWGNGAAFSVVQRLASEDLADWTRAAGFDPGAEQLKHICRLPENLIRQFSQYRRVHEFRTDRKTFEDNRPRIKRTIAGIAPMQIVFGDVHHMDVEVRRPDGTTATPKAVAWMDVGTGRVRFDIFLMDKGEMIKNVHLIQSFIAMSKDPYWGVPSTLYIDNGSEYLWADFVADALALTRLGGRVEYLDRKSPIQRARPYNAPAKSIEGFFGVFERTVLSAMPGYIGGNRMRKRTANVGRSVAPFPGTFEDFCERAQGLLQYYNTQPQHGELKGHSPLEMFRRAADAGWERITVDENALVMAFSTRATRKVRQGCIEVEGITYTDDVLAVVNGETVQVVIPKYQEWNVIPVLSKDGRYLGTAKPQRIFGFDDTSGAREAARLEKVAKRSVHVLSKEVETIDLTDRIIASGAKFDPGPIPPTGAIIGASDQAAFMGREVKETSEERGARKITEAQRAHLKRLQQLGLDKKGVV
ncbi:Mu transposase C-terminal domain-containing protein [Microvirga sp. CF3062]|uniref:Mu transposase C-terminal domain-containing protein n=1 Tax=Microvirga sp. CF3062 TaxID=3110182 RepID=UPI002E76579B|nr:Mu transposase C-terminal domain-containing protein [Microvirga sp. CF3062]MEE1656481.1 Mu transposase C-terminal domain-containing protein [Microvirga sp. CF3062]